MEEENDKIEELRKASRRIKRKEECPKCKRLQVSQTIVDTGEKLISCLGCGRLFDTELIGYEKGQPKYSILENSGGGFFRILVTKDNGDSGCFHKGYFDDYPSEQNIQDFLEKLELENVDKESSYMTAWDEENEELISIYGKLPLTYKEIINRTTKRLIQNNQ